MTFEECDRALASWNQRLAAIADNLLELQADTTYQLLTGSRGVPKVQLTGQSATKIVPILASVETIFQHFGLLQSVIDQAAQLRKEMRPVFGRDQALREIAALLEGESIQLPATLVPLDQRTLLSGLQSARGIRPEQLVASMAGAFTAARDAVLAVSRAWDDLTLDLNAAEDEIARLREQALAIGCDVPVELHRARNILDTAKAEMQTDPLTASAELKTHLRQALNQAGRSLQARVGLQQQFQDARATLEHLQELEAQTAAALTRRRAKILGDSPAAASLEINQHEHLQTWLARLQQRCLDQKAESIAVGLRNWQVSADGVAQRAAEALRMHCQPIEMRNELRGRLGALKAKARVYGRAEEATLVGLAASAEGLLYTQPTDLARAAAAVEAYERSLSAPTALANHNQQPRETQR